MQVTHGIALSAGAALRGGPIGLTIGNFDGVHRGHRAMLERLVAKSRELKLQSCVLTFEPHPREFFTPGAAPTRLTRLREKLELIAQAGVDRVHVLRFDARLAALTAARFIEEVLLRGLGVRWLLVGRDFRFGAKRSGDYAQLEAAAVQYGFGLEEMPEVLDGSASGGQRVSSSAVRAALAAGDLDGAARLLGRPYTMSGRVAHGEKLGRTLGFPTANIVLRRRPPLAGIFAVTVRIEEEMPGQQPAVLRGAASVGRRPTVKENAAPLLEVHLLDWDGAQHSPLYGRHLRVEFLHKLRDEAKYDGLDALRAAIRQDVEQTRDYFRKHG
ncbi:MAG: bifunctional riboflavin kinase/FAD synthetase [Betaproteobacteria bacterium]|nr:bifunctional riboflavin kinase/FAD synthetase [Betaproteobacteria bacterium]